MRYTLFYLVFSFITSVSVESFDAFGRDFYERRVDFPRPVFVAHAQNLASAGTVAGKPRRPFLNPLSPAFPSTSSKSNIPLSGNTFNAFFPAFEEGEEAEFTLAPLFALLQNEPSEDNSDEKEETAASNTENAKA